MSTETEGPPLPPAGWYPDPEMAATQRYWDGERWTEHRAPGKPEPSVDGGLVAFGWVTVVVFPLIGLLLGLWLLWGRQQEQGGWMALVALVWSAVLAVFVL